jgi:hypothetical protein
MTPNYFGYSGFVSFKILHTRSSRSAFTRIQWIFAMHPSGSDGPGSLRDFGVRLIRTLQQSVLPEYILSESNIVRHASFLINGQDLLWDFGVWEFLPFHIHFLPKIFHPKLMIYRCVSPTNRRLQITSGLHASRVSKYSSTQTSRVQSSRSVRSPDMNPLLSMVRMNRSRSFIFQTKEPSLSILKSRYPS